MNAEEFVRFILQARNRQERSSRLAQVPFHLREMVKARVERELQRRNTRNRSPCSIELRMSMWVTWSWRFCMPSTTAVYLHKADRHG